jgi:hypothetical protein
VSGLRKDTTASAHGGHPAVPGPEAAPARVLHHFESAGHRDPAEAWRAFTTAWNWAAPLTAAATAGDRAQAPARPDGGGFSLSGRWRLPSQDGTDPRVGETDPWVVLPLHAPGTPSAPVGPAPGGPDLFVVPSRTLAGGVRDRGSAHTQLRFPFVRLEDVHVPTGFTAYSTAEPLRSGDGPSFWAATAGLALGAARRIVDAAPAPEHEAAWQPDPACRAGAELAAVLHDERLSLAAALAGAPPAVGSGRFPTGERLAARFRRVAQVVHHTVASAYELSLASCGGIGDPTPLILIDAGAPILQLARYAVELLPPADTISSRKAEHGDDRRISG